MSEPDPAVRRGAGAQHGAEAGRSAPRARADTPGRTSQVAAPAAPADRAAELERALVEAERKTAVLQRALAATDFLAAWRAAEDLKRTFAYADAMGAAASEPAAHRLAGLRTAAAPLLAQAPRPSPAAIRDATSRSGRTAGGAWQTEEHQWRASQASVSQASAASPLVVPAALVLAPGADAAPGQAQGERDAAGPDQRPVGTPAQYLFVNSNPAWRALASYLRDVTWPDVSPRLTWAEPAFTTATLGAIHDVLGDFEPHALAALLHPQDALAVIDPLRPVDRKTWAPAVGTALGQLFHAALAGSVRRMAARYVDAADARQAGAPHDLVTVELAQLVTSHPIDRCVARGLTARGVASVAPDAAVISGARKPPRAGLRPVTLSWEGGRDPRLWSFVRATRADATAEEVVASLLALPRDRSAGDATALFANGLAAMPPLFGLPAAWALQFPAARAHAPAALRQGKVPDLAHDSGAARLAAVASSATVDPIALAQAHAGPRDPRVAAMPPAAVAEVLGECAIQLAHLRQLLTPWELANDIVAELLYITRKQHELTGVPADHSAAWAPIALGQRDRLYRIAGAVHAVISAAGPLAAGKRSASAAPLRQILSGLAAAAATSHLGETSDQLLAEAEAAQAGLSLRALQANAVDLEAAMSQAHDVAGGDRHNRDLAAPYQQATDGARRLENQMLRGVEPSPEELERVQLVAQETALRARLHGLQVQLDLLEQAGDAALVGLTAHIAQYGSSRFRQLHDATAFLHAAVGEIYLDLVTEPRAARPTSTAGDASALPADLVARRTALARAQARFARLGHDHDLARFLSEGARAVRNQQIRSALIQAGAMIGIAILTSGVGGWVAEGLGEGYLAAQGVETVSQLSLGARAAIQAGAFATETTGNAIGQQLTGGGSLGAALVDNAVFSLGTAGTLGAIARDLHAAAAFEKLLARELAAIDGAEARAAAAMTAAARAGRAVAWTARQAVSITSHTVMGMALGSVVGRLHGQPHPSPAQLDEWLIQGASVALGRLTHAAIGDRLPSYARLAQRKDMAQAQRLYQEAQQLHALSVAIANHPSADAALELLRKRNQVLEAELAALDELAAHTSTQRGTGAPAGPSSDELHAMRADLQAQLAEARSQAAIDLQWHLIGLHELAPDVWSGTPDQLAAAVRSVRATHRRVDVGPDTGDGIDRLTVDGRAIELHERAAPGRASNRTGMAGGRLPGEHGATPVTAAHQRIAATLGARVTPLGDNRYGVAPTRLADLHRTLHAKPGAQVSAVHYDPETHSSQFDLELDGNRVRVVASLEPRIESFAQLDAGINRIVGRPITSADGPRILRAIVKGDASALAEVGLPDAARMPSNPAIEFGLGDIGNGRVVVICGEPKAVDWTGLPGVTPIGHTHPSVATNDLMENHLGQREISIDDLLRVTDVPLLARELVFPSADDFLVMAHLGVDGHRVYTPYIVRDQSVMKAAAGDRGPRLEFAIGKPREVGHLSDGCRVYRSRIEGSIGGSPDRIVIATDIWIIADAKGDSGHLYMSEPVGIIIAGNAETAR